MANKSNLVTLPLQGPINLSKNKLDVKPIGNNGFLKINAPVYGNTLSPVYMKDSDVKHSLYDKNEDYYDVGASAIQKNGTTLFTYDEYHFAKETLDYTYVSSLLDKDHYCRVLTDSFIWNNYTFYFSSHDIATILATRVLSGDEIILFYIDSQGSYKVTYAVQTLDSCGRPRLNKTTFSPSNITNVGSPIITKFEIDANQMLCSVITDSGADINASSVNIYINNYQAKQVTFEPTEQSSITISAYSMFYFKDLFNYTFARGSWSGDNHDRLYLQWSQKIPPVNQYDNTPYSIGVEGQGYKASNSYTWNTNGGSSFEPTTREELLNSPYNTYTSAQMLDISQAYDRVSVEGVFQYFNAPNVVPLLGSDVSANEEANAYFWLDFGDVYNEDTDSIEHLKLKWVPHTAGSGKTSNKALTSFMNSFGFDSDYGTFYREDGSVYEKDYFLIPSTINVTTLEDYKCNAILDNGTFICLDTVPTETEDDLEKLKSGAYNFTGDFYDVQDDVVHYALTNSQKVYLALDKYTNDSYPYYFKSQVKSLGYDYFRDNILTLAPDKETVTQILYDTGFDKVLLNPGYNTSTNTNGKGSVAETSGWRVLYNNNYISGISFSTDPNYVGTLLTDWNSVASILNITSDDIYYLDNYGKVQRIYLEQNEAAAPFSLIEDRFIVVNTTSYINCYDIDKDVFIHYASDYNNRFFEGAIIDDALTINSKNSKLLQNGVSIVTDASSQNANYEMTNNPIVGLTLAVDILTGCLINKYNRLKSENLDGIDYYRSISETTASYDVSYKNGVEYKNTLLEDAVYPSDTPLYNPNIFTMFIKTYNQRDLVLNTANNTAYPLMKYNGQIFLIYPLTSGLENAENMFVIQTLHYMISNGFIFEVYYNGAEIDTYQAIMPIDGLTYLGCLPTEALFWCSRDRSVYSFAGDAIMRKVYQWNEVSEIYKTFYTPATQELFIATDVGLLCISNNYQYLLSDFLSVDNIYFYSDHFVVSDVTDISCSYERLEDFTGVIHFVTDFLGDNALKSKYDCYYLRIYHNNEDNGVITIKSKTVTDMGVETDERMFEFGPNDWDELTDSIYIRYQPKYQTACAMSFEVTSTNPIISHQLGFTETNEIPAVSHINI